MPIAHFYLFSDACPTDWLGDGQDATWHTVATFAFQSDPAQQPQVDAGTPHAAILGADPKYGTLVRRLESQLPPQRLRQWKKTDERYRDRFCRSFDALARSGELMISACSFQERTLRAGKTALLASYNKHIGGVEGRGIGFEEWRDASGRLNMKHSFVNFSGYHEVAGLEGQVLVLLLMSWFVADQFVFHSKRLAMAPCAGFDALAMTVVSDHLSGDTERRPVHEANLRRLIDPDENAPISLTRSPQREPFSGDLIVDNLAGLLKAAVSDPTGKFGEAVRRSADSGVWRGWHLLRESTVSLELTPALERITNGMG